MNARRIDRQSELQPAPDCQGPDCAPALSRQDLRCAALSCAVLVSSLLSGCAAFRPMDGVPARYLPDELRGSSKETMQMIDLSMLRRRQESQYRVDSGDVLAVYIENILGRADQPPINQQTAGNSVSLLNGNRPPTLGFPLSVRDDGTVAIPRFGPILVRGRTIPEIEGLVRSAFTREQRYLTPQTQNRVVVSLHQPRQHRVLVFRQDSSQDTLSTIDISNGQIGATKRGNGRVVSLPAGKNDVLHALVESGGLPGLDARDTIWVIRSRPVPKPVNPVAYRGEAQQAPPLPGHPQSVMRAPSRMMPQSAIPRPGRGQPMSAPQSGILPPGMSLMSDAIMPGHAAIRDAGTSTRGQTAGAILQAGYQSLSNPVSGMKNDAAVSLPYTQQSGSIRQIAGQPVDTATGRIAMAVRPADPRGYPHGAVSAAGCQSCQTGPAMSQGLPAAASGYGFPSPVDARYTPLSGQWQSPPAWDHLSGMSVQGLCSLGRTVRIPLRVKDCSALNLSEQDVQLNDGDILLIQSRDDEVFYTGGLLGGGQYNLPRDHDIDILEAISIAQGRNAGSGQDNGRSALNNDVTISASQAVILRKLPNGSQVPILVDLYRARKYRAERMLIQRGDFIVLQYTRAEALAAFVERHILETALFGVAAAQLNRGR